MNRRELGIEVSSIEVYCDIVKDLFGTGPSANDARLISVKDKVVIEGQTWKKVETLQDFLNYIKQSSEKRIFKSNGVNEHSSRSHHIFQVKIAGQNVRFEHFSSILSIIDLAGSERRSGMANLQK
jgi:kinesin family protein C1